MAELNRRASYSIVLCRFQLGLFTNNDPRCNFEHIAVQRLCYNGYDLTCNGVSLTVLYYDFRLIYLHGVYIMRAFFSLVSPAVLIQI